MTSSAARRTWVLLFGVAVLALAGCATGALDCAIGRPLGVLAAVGAGLASLFDGGASGREDGAADER